MKLTQNVTFDSAHRLFNYDGNCGNLHGHTWKVGIEIDSEKPLNEVSMLIDYKVIKQYFKDYWDHRVVLNMDDPLVDALKQAGQNVSIMDGNPTAENIAKKILADMILLADLDIKGLGDWASVIVHESEDNSAEVSI